MYLQTSTFRWNLSSFFNKATAQSGDQPLESNSSKDSHQDGSRHREASSAASSESRSAHRSQHRDWELDEALKRNRTTAILSALSDSEHHSDAEKKQATEPPRAQVRILSKFILTIR